MVCLDNVEKLLVKSIEKSSACHTFDCCMITGNWTQTFQSYISTHLQELRPHFVDQPPYLAMCWQTNPKWRRQAGNQSASRMLAPIQRRETDYVQVTKKSGTLQ